MSEDKKFDLELKSELKAKAAPDMEKVTYKAVAGQDKADLIKRNTIGEYEEEEEEQGEERRGTD